MMLLYLVQHYVGTDPRLAAPLTAPALNGKRLLLLVVIQPGI